MSEKEKGVIENLESREKNAEKLKEAGNENRVELEKQLEKNAERSGETNPDDARHEVERITAEAEKAEEQKRSSNAEKDDQKQITKHDIDTKYKETMKNMQSQLNAPSRTFSKVIHNPVIEKTSDAIANTVARPNLVISGALGAIASVVVYIIARTYGYELSGFETIGLFILGWAIGAVIEYIRVGLFNKK